MIDEQVVFSPVQARSVAQGLLYRQLAEGFAYPTAERLRAWQDGSTFGAIAEAADALDEPELQAAVERLEQSLADVGQVSQPAVDAADSREASRLTLEEEYTYLFLRQAVAPPYEGSYLVQSFFVQPQMLADAGGFYSAFGLQVAGDLADHLGAELEFLSVLCLKEAYAREQGWAERAETCVQARRRFLAEHIGRWLPVFVTRVKENARLPLFVALAELTSTLVAFDCAAFGITPDQSGVFVPEPTDAREVPDDGMCAA